MKNNKGITLISLVSSIILLLILASTTISTSMNAYKQMKFEGAKAEIEEFQKIVDQIASDYQTYAQEVGVLTPNYKDYFNARYGNNTDDFSGMRLSQNASKIANLKAKHTELESSLTASDEEKAFYFDTNDLFKYFGLKGISPMVVDFSTRKVYSVNGIKDSSDNTKIYYTQTDWGAKPQVIFDDTKTAITMTAEQKNKDITGKIFNIELKFSSKINCKVSEIYYSLNGTGSNLKVSDFKDISTDTETKFRVTITGCATNQQYKFIAYDEYKNIYQTTVLLKLN